MPAPPGNREKQKTRKMLEKKRKEFKGDPRIKMKPSPLPKGPPKPKKGSNMKSYEPMGAGMRNITARRGDNLTHIAQRAGTTVGTIKKLNSAIKNVDKIKVGQKIRVPTPK
mgnify:CR=1 FL=1